MEHFIRIAFWIISVSLSFSHPIKKRWAISDFGETYLQNITCQPDSIFYAPTDVKRECFTAALDCVLREFKVAIKDECTDPEEKINQTADFLAHVIDVESNKGNALKNSSECTCELWSQAPFSTFLSEAKSLLQRINSSN